MAKRSIKLKLDLEYDFCILGISSREIDYRISYFLNNVLEINFTKDKDIQYRHPKLDLMLSFSVFSYEDHEALLFYQLISNRTVNGFHIEEMSNFEYFLKISGEVGNDKLNEIQRLIKNIDCVMFVTKVDIKNLKSKKKFVF